MEPTKSPGRIARGWQLTKSSWQVLKMDKELMTLPVISMAFSLIALLVIGAGYLTYMMANSSGHLSGSNSSFEFRGNPWINGVFMLVVYFVTTLIANIFSGAIIFGATERFRGGDPTVGSSLRGAMRKFRPLALFSLLLATVGLLLNTLEQKVPLAGKIAIWLVNASWSIANVFALPVIVLSDKDISPLAATRESVAIIRKIWGESVVADVSMGLVAGLSILGYFMIASVLGLGVGSIPHIPGLVVGVYAGIVIVGAIFLALIFTTLSAILKAALYHYATTGEAPADFSSDLLRRSMTQKKARKIFAR